MAVPGLIPLSFSASEDWTCAQSHEGKKGEGKREPAASTQLPRIVEIVFLQVESPVRLFAISDRSEYQHHHSKPNMPLLTSQISHEGFARHFDQNVLRPVKCVEVNDLDEKEREEVER